MGGCLVLQKRDDYSLAVNSMKESVLCKMMDESDVCDFVSCSKVEGIPNAAVVDIGNSRVLVVTGGTVVANIGKPNKNNGHSNRPKQKYRAVTIARTLNAGDIVLFPQTDKPSDTSGLNTGKMELFMSVPKLSKTAQIAKVPLEDMNKFLLSRTKLSVFHDMTKLKISDLLINYSVLFRNCSSNQANLLCPLLKLHYVPKEGTVSSTDHKINSNSKIELYNWL